MKSCSVFHHRFHLFVLLFFSVASLWTSEGSQAAMPNQLGGRERGRTSQPPAAKKQRIDSTVTPVTMSPEHDGSLETETSVVPGKLEELKQREAELSRLLASVRQEKLSTIRSRPLSIGVIGFGRFGQFIAKTFQKYGRVTVTSRSDYTKIANEMGVKYVPLSDPQAFLDEQLDVIVVATSIVSFEHSIKTLAPHLKNQINQQKFFAGAKTRGPLIVDVLSVKEHARQIMIDLLPSQCDILCTHPMFGPDSGKNGWSGLNFVYEKTRIGSVLLDPDSDQASKEEFTDAKGSVHSVHEDDDAHVEGIDRMERFLSIWEEEGCRMISMSCKDHDSHAANSQFLTHLMGRILGAQGLSNTPIDTKGFESVLKLVDTTTADSFDLFFGLYKYNQNSMKTILNLRSAMEDVVEKLKDMEKQDSK